jgi:hypothetical protein
MPISRACLTARAETISRRPRTPSKEPGPSAASRRPTSNAPTSRPTPNGAVAREQRRVKCAKKEKPDA